MLEYYSQTKGVNMNTQHLAQQIHYYTSGYPFLVSKLCKIMDEELVKEKYWGEFLLEKALRSLLQKDNRTEFNNYGAI